MKNISQKIDNKSTEASNRSSNAVGTAPSTEAKGKVNVGNVYNLSEPNILKREMSVITVTDFDTSYAGKVKKFLREIFFLIFDTFNSSIEDKDLEIKYKKQESIENLAIKLGINYKSINPNHEKEFNSILCGLCFKENPTDDNVEIMNNAIITFDFMQCFFQKNFEYESERNCFSKFQREISNTEEEIDFKNINMVAFINKFSVLNDKVYFSFIRQFLDLDLDYKSKVKTYLEFLGAGYSDLSKLIDPSDFVEAFEKYSRYMKNIVAYVTYVHILLDALQVFKSVPKTKYNLQIMLEICNNCYKFFEEDIEGIRIAGNRFEPYGIAHSSILSFIKDLKNTFEKLILPPKKEDDWGTDITKAFEKGKKKTAVSRGGHKSRKGNLRNNAHIYREEPKVESKPKAVVNASTSNLIQIAAVTNLQNNNVHVVSIAEETSELMRAFRQELEKYRVQGKQEEEERLRIKQEHDALAQLSAMAQPNQAPPVQTVPVANLKDAHISTWKALIVDKHLSVENADVNVLLTRLNGRSVGNGGSQFEIEFFDFNKNIYVRCGQYEDNHGQDRSDRLKKGQGKNVCQAIDSGISRGLINISQESKDKVFGKIN